MHIFEIIWTDGSSSILFAKNRQDARRKFGTNNTIWAINKVEIV